MCRQAQVNSPRSLRRRECGIHRELSLALESLELASLPLDASQFEQGPPLPQPLSSRGGEGSCGRSMKGAASREREFSKRKISRCCGSGITSGEEIEKASCWRSGIRFTAGLAVCRCYARWKTSAMCRQTRGNSARSLRRRESGIHRELNLALESLELASLPLDASQFEQRPPLPQPLSSRGGEGSCHRSVKGPTERRS